MHVELRGFTEQDAKGSISCIGVPFDVSVPSVHHLHENMFVVTVRLTKSCNANSGRLALHSIVNFNSKPSLVKTLSLSMPSRLKPS